MKYANKSDAVRDAAKGRWFDIFRTLAPDLKDAINNCPNHVLDPVHGGKNDDGFRLFKDADQTGGGISNTTGPLTNGFAVLMWMWDCDFKTVLNDVADFLGLQDWKQNEITPKNTIRSKSYIDEHTVVIDQETLNKRRSDLRKKWCDSFNLDSPKASLARSYFARRGLDLSKLNLIELSKTIRFNPSISYWHKGKYVGNYPALITLVSYKDGTPATIHRTYLDCEGRKLKIFIGDDQPVLPAKKLMARCECTSLSGGAIRIGKENERLDVSEGIETALSVMQVENVPVWPCVNNILLAKFEPPQGVKHLVVWADKDRPKLLPSGKVITVGLDAANELSERMKALGIRVTIKLPNDDIPDDEKGVDWNDVLIKHKPSDHSVSTVVGP